MHIQHRIFKICNKQLISFAEELQMLSNTHLWKQFSTLLANTLNMDPFVVSQLFPCLLHYSTIIANQRVSRMQHLHVSVKIGLRHERFIADVAYNSLWDWNRRTITDYSLPPHTASWKEYSLFHYHHCHHHCDDDSVSCWKTFWKVIFKKYRQLVICHGHGNNPQLIWNKLNKLITSDRQY